MNLLLDTHVFIWMAEDSPKLSTVAKDAIQDGDNTVFLSLTSIWEMQIKIQLGKLSISGSLAETLDMQQQTNGVQFLPISLVDILALSKLPQHHRDPFDRLLIAQSVNHDLTLITNDSKIQKYDVNWTF
jgi:PIN domain nuclease of toxin-antitoxin system